MKKNRSLRGSTLLALILIVPVLWLAVLIWPAVAHSQQETRWPTHYVIVVRNTSLKVPNPNVELISESEFRTGIEFLPRGLVAASGKISLWRKPEPGDLISVVFAAAGKHPISRPGCESHHYPDSSVPNQSTPLKLSTYFDVRAHIFVDSSSNLHQQLLQNLVVQDCDLIANAYSESLTLAKVLAAVEVGDANEEERYKQFFLLVFDFASPAYGSTEFNATFTISHEDLAPGTPAYVIAPVGSLKFANRDWSSDLVNYLDYPADEPGGTAYLRRNTGKFYPRLRFYRAVAHEPGSDPFYNLADSQRKVASLEEKSKTSELQVAQLKQQNVQLKQQNAQLDLETKKTRISALIAWSLATTFALLTVLVTWRWWAIKGRFRRMAEEYEKKLQRVREEQSRLAENQQRQLLESQQALAEEFRERKAALGVEMEEQKRQQAIMAHFLLTSAICIPDDAPDTGRASESA